MRIIPLLLFFLCFEALAFKLDHRPVKGEVLWLTEGVLELKGEEADIRIEKTLDNLPYIMGQFTPDLGRNGKIKSYENDVNDEGHPYFILAASLKIKLPVIPAFSVTRTVIAEAIIKKSSCDGGKKIVLDLKGSSPDILHQAEKVYLEVCITEISPDKAKLSYKAEILVGENFGTKLAGPLVMDVLTLQVGPILKELKKFFESLKGSENF